VRPGEAVIGAGDVVLVTGGARGVTAACMVAWARECRARFVLLGRTGLEPEPACCEGIDDDAELMRALLQAARDGGETLGPAELRGRVHRVRANREIRATLAAMTEAGAEARYEAVSVADRAAMSEMLARVRGDWGPVAAVVHGAGVLADGRIADKTDAQFDRVFDTKVVGLRTLMDLTQDDPLRLICLFSSVSGRCGNPGQAAYAMANELMSKVAGSLARERGPKTLVKSLGWGPWEAGMVTPQLKQRFADLGVPMIPLAEGARMLVDELHGAQPDQVELVLGGEPKAEALLFEGHEGRVLQLEVKVDRDSHGYLSGHAIAGTPVVPVVLVMEWFARAAECFHPGLELAAIRDIQVLKGIRLDRFDNGGDRFVVVCRASDRPGDGLAMELRGTGGSLHYRARVDRVEDPAWPASAAPRPGLDDWAGAVIYGDVLFHDGDFQVIHSMDGISDEGISGVLRGVKLADWTGESWRLDIAALDGALQLAVLWARRMLGGATLPTRIEEYRSYTTELPRGLIQCVVVQRHVGRAGVTTDIVLTDEDGGRVAELIGVQTHIIPSQAKIEART
jgi:NAD(P)-dependent dehydrogenase (short-subunit alcohol dehydrogenase family)